jgi:hypothetical protein
MEIIRIHGHHHRLVVGHTISTINLTRTDLLRLTLLGLATPLNGITLPVIITVTVCRPYNRTIRGDPQALLGQEHKVRCRVRKGTNRGTVTHIAAGVLTEVV